MKPSEVLQEALTELKKGPGGWTKHEYAKNAVGAAVSPGHVSAICRCAIGHLLHAGGVDKIYEKWPTEVNTGVRYLSKAITGKLPKHGHEDVASFNDKDETKYEDVVAIFEKAVVMAKKVGR